jgi:ribosomal protein S27E
MSLEMTRECPECDEETTFWRAASMELHLGEKTKWRCSECEHTLVLIGGEGGIDSSADA